MLEAVNGVHPSSRLAIGNPVDRHRYRVVPSIDAHVGMLLPKLRIDDLAEIDGTGSTARRSLWRGLRNSIVCETAFVDDEIAAMWGLAVSYIPGVSLLSDKGAPWLLTSAAVERVPFAVVREGRYAVARMLRIKPKLENYVLASYTRAVRTLRLIGFKIDKPEPIGRNGALYSRFHMGFE